ncbi:histidine phosphatase family protein [Pseudactinotalea sp. HY158]|uniref:histidine phosphatase family protein n=1 Tax=Pseudactinotalea sp. HY158 TaxID=2654547 RepID=UPI00129D07E9|nr:histidine phosphatase family protein [Pseudactinotalea sp. HY158]QGH69790.1 histidine phosphatase family protein [Pseudactinotalea sp. HY158]
MSAGTVILWRHGQTDYNAEGRLQGQIDIPLNDVGRAQAALAAEQLALLEPAAIVSSDLSRAVETGRALGELTGLDVTTDERLRERSFGIWEGRTHTEMRAEWPDAFAQWRRGAHPEGIDAESREELGERLVAAVGEIAGRYERSDTVVLVAHGAAIATGITALLGQNPEGWRGIAGLGNCHWSTLQPYGGQPAWRLTGHNVGVPVRDFTSAGRIV